MNVMQPFLKELINKCPYLKLTRMLCLNYIQMHQSLKTIVFLIVRITVQHSNCTIVQPTALQFTVLRICHVLFYCT